MFHKDLFVLIRRYYFSRLDRDGNGMLSADEYVFQPKPLDALYLVTPRRIPLDQDPRVEGVPNCRLARRLPDGKWIAFDGYKASEASPARGCS